MGGRLSAATSPANGALQHGHGIAPARHGSVTGAVTKQARVRSRGRLRRVDRALVRLGEAQWLAVNGIDVWLTGVKALRDTASSTGLEEWLASLLANHAAAPAYARGDASLTVW
jgi:hypothetical protein